MATQKTTEKWKLKKWFSVYAPKIFNEVVIAEIPANDEKGLVGKNLKVSLDSLTHNPQNSYTNIYFKITGVDGSKVKTRIVKIEILFSYLRSLVRRYRSISSSVLKASSKDNVSIIVKPVVITAKKETHSRISGIRKEMNQFLEGYISENNYDEIIGSVIDGKLQAQIYNKINHIAKLSKVEIRKLEIK